MRLHSMDLEVWNELLCDTRCMVANESLSMETFGNTNSVNDSIGLLGQQEMSSMYCGEG